MGEKKELRRTVDWLTLDWEWQQAQMHTHLTYYPPNQASGIEMWTPAPPYAFQTGMPQWATGEHPGFFVYHPPIIATGI